MKLAQAANRYTHARTRFFAKDSRVAVGNFTNRTLRSAL